MLIAILVFLLAALSGTIVLTMAESNAGRYTHEKEDQQAYLAVASAAKIILDTLDGVQVRFEGNKVGIVPQSSSDVAEPKYYKKSSTGAEEELTDLKLFFKDSRFTKQLKDILPYGEQVEESGDTEEPKEPTPIPEGYKPVSFTLSVDGDKKSSVLVEFDMHEKTLLTIRLWYAENGNKSYQMTVRVNLDDGAQWETSKEAGEDDSTSTYYANLSWKTDSATYTFEREYSEKNPEAEKEGAA